MTPARDLLGKTLRLITPYPCAGGLTIRWRVRSYSLGVVKIESISNGFQSVVDWPELRSQIQSGRLEVE